MTSINKFFEIFRHLKSDAVPRPPRPSKEKPPKPESEEENNENVDYSNEPEEILVESGDEEVQDEKKPKFKKFFKPNKKEGKPKKDKHSSSTVNTQATGNVINVVNSKNVRWGNDYYMGPAYMSPGQKHFPNEEESEPEEEIKKCNDIKLLLKAPILPEHEYLYHISKNLGKKWQNFFIKLGYSKNFIETKVIDTEKYGVSEARYKLLLDWIDTQEDHSLGRLATLLWKDGERQLVKELALMYKKNIKQGLRPKHILDDPDDPIAVVTSAALGSPDPTYSQTHPSGNKRSVFGTGIGYQTKRSQNTHRPRRWGRRPPRSLRSTRLAPSNNHPAGNCDRALGQSPSGMPGQVSYPVSLETNNHSAETSNRALDHSPSGMSGQLAHPISVAAIPLSAETRALGHSPSGMPGQPDSSSSDANNHPAGTVSRALGHSPSGMPRQFAQISLATNNHPAGTADRVLSQSPSGMTGQLAQISSTTNHSAESTRALGHSPSGMPRQVRFPHPGDSPSRGRAV